jgi:hypothetical protein
MVTTIPPVSTKQTITAHLYLISRWIFIFYSFLFKIKNKIYHTVRTVPKSNRKIVHLHPYPFLLIDSDPSMSALIG